MERVLGPLTRLVNRHTRVVVTKVGTSMVNMEGRVAMQATERAQDRVGSPVMLRVEA